MACDDISEESKKVKMKKEFERFKRIVPKLKLTEKDADESADKVKASMYEKLIKLFPNLE